MQGLIVDPYSRRVYTDDRDWTLRDMQEVVHGYIQLVDIGAHVPLLSGWSCYLDDEGRLKENEPWGLIGWPERYLMGPMLVLGMDDEGENAPCDLRVQDLWRLVVWQS